MSSSRIGRSTWGLGVNPVTLPPTLTALPAASPIAVPVEQGTPIVITMPNNGTTVTTASDAVNTQLGLPAATAVTTTTKAGEEVAVVVIPEVEDKEKKYVKYGMYAAGGLLVVAIAYRLMKQ